MSTTRSPGDEGRPASLEPIAVQEVRGAELTALEADRAEGNVDRDIEQEISDLSTIAQKLLSSSADKRRMLILVMRIRERLAHWTAEQRELVEAVERTQGEQASGASPQQRPGLRALQELLAVARERGPNDPLVLGLQSGYVRVALRTLRTLRERAQQFQEQISRLREEFDGVKDKLRRDYNIVVWGGSKRLARTSRGRWALRRGRRHLRRSVPGGRGFLGGRCDASDAAPKQRPAEVRSPGRRHDCPRGRRRLAARKESDWRTRFHTAPTDAP